MNEINLKQWPFIEAKKLLKRLKNRSKKEIIFQTGYGPSGLPHIGTFGEVLRTSMVIKAFQHLSSLPTKLFVFSDDMDGLRKVPKNVPNKDMIERNLEKPLSNIPDPFKKYNSFGEHNNEILKEFLNKFKFKFTFKSSTENYKNGIFNKSLIRVAEKYEEVILFIDYLLANPD